jgi:hypothetical protein
MSDPTDDNKQPTLPDFQKSIADAEDRTKQLPLHETVQAERTELMQIEAMLRCLREVLLYADDDDSLMHADVAHVSARLLNDSITRLEVAVAHHLQGLASVASPSESAAVDPSSSAPADSGEKP